MNGAIKARISNYDQDDYTNQIHILAKTKYKLQQAAESKQTIKQKFTQTEAYKLIYEYTLNPDKYKQDITEWLINLNDKDFKKVMIIESKFQTDLILQMFAMLQNGKKDYRFSQKTSKEKEQYREQNQEYKMFRDTKDFKMKNQLIVNSGYRHNLEMFFGYREPKDLSVHKQIIGDKEYNVKDFLFLLRVLDLYEPKDCITINREECKFDTVVMYLNTYSHKRYFSEICWLVELLK